MISRLQNNSFQSAQIYSPYATTPMENRAKELIQLLPSNRPAPALFFLHVPKTGGTDIAIKLQDSMRFNVFSLDASEEDYRLQLEWFNPKRPTFIRAHMYYHHAWTNFLKHENSFEVFTIIRSPYALHLSLATMILERNLYKVDGENVPIPSVVSHHEFIEKLLSVIKSPGYLDDYQNIYMKYFSLAFKNESLLNRLRVIGIDQVDALQQKLIPGDPLLCSPRLNQSRGRLDITATELLNNDLMLWLSRLVSPEEIDLYRKLQSKVGNVLWAPSSVSLRDSKLTGMK